MTKPIEINARELLQALGRREISFQDVVDKFSKATFVVPPRPKDLGEMYLRAEEGDDRDVPTALYAAQTAGTLSQRQWDQLMNIYDQRVTGGPATAPAAGSPSAG